MVEQSPAHTLNERAQHLLKVLVQLYIRDGQPVGSRTLTRGSGLDLSPATVRNAMADLEEGGFIRAPHTSAGRVPTDKGYRFFVDSLTTVQPLAGTDMERLRIRLEGDGDLGSLVDSASNLLSGLTHLAGLVTLPRRGFGALRQVEFLPLSEDRLLAVVVLNNREIQNRIIHTDREYSRDELQAISNYLNAEFAGREVSEVRRALVNGMKSDRDRMSRLMTDAISMAQTLFQDEPQGGDFVLAGETNLMNVAELCNVDRLRELFDAFSRKRDILDLLDRCLSADGVQIYIGQESGYEVFDGVSLVTCAYRADDVVLGVLGVIGPTRMPYDRVIPVVDVTARLLGHALNPHH